MPRRDEAERALLEHVAVEHLDGGEELTPHTPLLEWGIIDSLGLAQLLGFLEARFGVVIPSDAITPANFESVAALAAMVERLTGSER